MSKIYLVMSQCGMYEDYYEIVEKAFKDIKKAEAYMAEKIDTEQGYRDMADKCKDCGGLDRSCPFYTMPTYEADECAAYEPYHDNVEFRIEEVEFEE